MKTLKKYLTEGTFDIEDNIESATESLIEDFIKENYNISGKIIINKVKDKYIVDCDGDVETKKSIKSLTNGLFEWGKVDGDFNCIKCKLKSLDGMPKAARSIELYKLDDITSLEGMTQNLDGSQIWTGIIKINHCNSLTSLKGIPKIFKKLQIDHCDSLKTIDYCPEKLEEIEINHCKSLQDIKAFPKSISLNMCLPKVLLGKLLNLEEVPSQICVL